MNFVRHNFGLKATALGVAILLWLGFSHVTAPQATFSKTLELPLKVRGASAGYVANSRADTINVELGGPRARLDPLAPEQFVAWVDVARRGAGVYALPVKIDGPAADAVKSMAPGQVIVAVDRFAYRSVPVVPGQGAPVQLDVLPKAVTVAGPESAVTHVLAATVSIPPTELSESRSVDIKPIPVDSRLAPVSGVTVAPPLVHVTVAGKNAGRR